MRTAWRIFLLWFLCAAVAMGQGFRVFDATQYHGKPDLSVYGIEKLTVIYGHFLWPDRKVTESVPPDDFLEARLREFGSRDGSPWCIDIEHWPVRGDDAEAQRSIDRYLAVLQAARRVAPPGTPIGFYGVVPIREYHAALEPHADARWQRWLGQNIRLAPLAGAVDVIFPSLYTFYDDPEEWVRYAVEQLEMARRFGKPVYAFLWPQYHESNRFQGLDYIDADFWRLQLETVAEHADGVVIWGGWDFAHRRPADWDEGAPWWLATRAFLAGRGGSK